MEPVPVPRDDAPPKVDPIALARALHARLGIQAPHEIAIELIAFHCGAVVLYRDVGSADARVVRAGDRAILAIAAHARGTPRARFSIAHELGHFLLHADCDAVARLHGGGHPSHHDFALERDADRFASEVLVPVSLAAPMFRDATPHLEAVGDLARAFNVSLTVAAMRAAGVSQRGCAFVETRRETVARAVRSAPFAGEAVQRRPLEEGTLALEMARVGGLGGTRVHERAWGASRHRPITEQCVPLGDGSPGGPVLTWLWHG